MPIEAIAEAEEAARKKEKAEKALTKTNNTANAEHTNTNKAKGEKTMKNTIKINRTNELNAKKAAEEAAKKAEALKDVKPLNIVETLKQLEEEKANAKVVCDKDGNPVAVCGGKYLCELYKGEVIGAETEEQLNAVKARVDKGIHGDGLLHKMVNINGKNIPCVGKTEKEVDQDIQSLEIYSKEHPEEPRRDLTVATMLKEAGFKSADLEQVTVSNNDYLLVYADPDGLKNYAMNLDGSTVKNKEGKEISLSDIEDELSRKTVKKLLTERLERAVVSKKPEPLKESANKPAAKATSKKTKQTEIVVEITTVPCGCCGILISKQLKSYTLKEVIQEILTFQNWDYEPCRGKKCPWLTEVSEEGQCLIAATPKVMKEAVIPAAAFIENRIVQESPVFAENYKELVEKISDIVYIALKDEPYFGIYCSKAKKLSDIMAAAIIRNSEILTR